ncbi:MAG: hypothetical protein LBB82_02530 [Treponema sp.]|nr:hypothetical protein [Treponema sp.]
MNDIVPTTVLAKRGLAAVGGIVGGVVLYTLSALPSFFGIAAGVIVGVIGFISLSSRESGDRLPGAICLAAGVLTVLSKLGFLGGTARFLLAAGCLGLVVLGVWNLIKFLQGMKSRS